MFCKNCGNEIKEGEEFCGKCGYTIQKKVESNSKQCKTCVRDITEEESKRYGGYCKRCYEDIHRKEDNGEKPNMFMAIVKLALYILAVVVVIMSFNAADDINSASYKMRNLRSVSGTSVDEAYYQYYGTFLGGIETSVKVLGMTSGVVIAYVGKKIKVHEGEK